MDFAPRYETNPCPLVCIVFDRDDKTIVPNIEKLAAVLDPLRPGFPYQLDKKIRTMG